jgi:D-xylose transport system permease protein
MTSYDERSEQRRSVGGVDPAASGPVTDPAREAPLDEDPTSPEAIHRAELAMSPDVLSSSFSEYARASLARIRGGEAGMLPVIAGLFLISVLFQSLNSNFLTAGNLVNLLIQGAAYMLLALGETYALLLGEIDLSIGFVSGIGGIITAELVRDSTGWPWWAAVLVALLACAAIGVLQGTIITRLGVPSFVVTLAGLLGWQGVMLLMLGEGGAIPINDDVINGISSGTLTPAASWIVMLAIVAAFALMTWRRDARRRAAGLVTPPQSVSVIKVVAALLAGIVVVLICNTDRGVLVPIEGVPWVVLVVLAVLAAWSVLLGRTKFGRYVYAIGGNAEAARRAGVSLANIRTLAFMLGSFTAGIAGVVYASRLRSVSTALDGGTLVLYAVAAAVIGGTSLFGGRGRAINAVLGGLVIAAIDNGMGLQGYSAAAKYVVTALVLLAAVTIDAVSRRGRVAR